MAHGLEKADAKAHATAAQIWAEMLGLVCHPEYYQLGEQKVSDQIYHTDVGFCSTLLRIPCLYILCDFSLGIFINYSASRHTSVKV